jgi:hypothetical protein
MEIGSRKNLKPITVDSSEFMEDKKPTVSVAKKR